VRESLFRKAGSHEKSEKAKRKEFQRELRKELELI